ncbi:MAG: hypothetical protein ACPG4T_11100, partial [Nannocystaceae bacterium]
ECTTGRRLWTGATMAELVTGQLSKTAPRLDDPEVCTEPVPQLFADLVERMLVLPPSQRPGSAEVLEQLSQLLLENSFETMTASVTGTAEALHVTPTTLEGNTQSRGAGRRGWQLGAGIAGLVLVVGVLWQVLGSSEEPELPEEAAVVAEKVIEPDLPTEPSEIAVKPIPTELEKVFKTVSSSLSDGRRKKAAKEIEDFEDQDAVPEILKLVAQLQMAESCRGKKVAVDRIGKLADPRGLPALRRYEPRGFHACGRRDCYSCMRKALANAIRSMGEEPSEKTKRVIGESD